LKWKRPATKDITHNNTNIEIDSKITSRVRVDDDEHKQARETSDLFTEVHLH
jgi:hypothetical protein